MRILYAVYLFACFILSNSYSSLFYSAITVPTLSRPIDTIEDLVAATSTPDRVRLAFKDEASIKTTIFTAVPQNRLYYHLLMHSRRVPPIVYRYQKEIIPLVESSRRVVLLALKINLLSRRYLAAKVPLHISSEPIEYYFIGWAMRKRSSFKAPFDLV